MLTTALVAALVLLHAAVLAWWRHGDRARDRLTGLASREHFTDVLTRCATQAVWRPEYRYAVVVLEIDHENRLRRQVGRLGVEDAIAETAERLALCTRGSDVVARIAERRFGVLLDDVGGAEQAHTAARRLTTELGEASTLTWRRVRTTPAVGLTVSGEWTLEPEEMLARAESSLAAPAALPADD